MSKGLYFAGHPWAGDGKLIVLLANQCPTQALAGGGDTSFPSCCLQALCVQSRRGKWDKGALRKAVGVLRVSRLFISALLRVLAVNGVKLSIHLELPCSWPGEGEKSCEGNSQPKSLFLQPS